MDLQISVRATVTPLSRRNLLEFLAGSAMVGLRGLLAGEEKASTFKVRATMECGWNVFRRKGYSTDPKDIAVNYQYLDQLHEAGLNWLMVFWTNAPEFDEAWAKASTYAHSLRLRLARGCYIFAGGEPETAMGEPNAPAHLLRMSARGTKSALCPHDPETRDWVAETLVKRLQPGMDGLVFEPPPETSQNCTCDQCRALNRFQLDAFMVNFLAEQVGRRKPDLEVMLHLNATGGKSVAQALAAGLRGLPNALHYIFAWNTDDEASLSDWLDADPRFQAFTHLSRTILFPDGKPSPLSIDERTAHAFRWARLAADRGKKAYSYDWRMFGGTEWKGHENELPTTRLSARMPASLALMGAALKDPYLNEKGQRELLKQLRATSEWDLDDPVTSSGAPNAESTKTRRAYGKAEVPKGSAAGAGTLFARLGFGTLNAGPTESPGETRTGRIAVFQTSRDACHKL